MQYYTLKVKDKEYKCRLTAKACVDLERKLGTNPLNVLARIANTNELPPLDMIISILHASMQSLEHGISIDDVYTIYDDYVEDGKTLIDLMPEIIEIFKVSGFFNDKDIDEKN